MAGLYVIELLFTAIFGMVKWNARPVFAHSSSIYNARRRNEEITNPCLSRRGRKQERNEQCGAGRKTVKRHR